MRKILFAFILLLVCTSVFSQTMQIKVKSFDTNMTDTKVRRASRYDNTHQMAALIRVICPALDSVEFKGDLVGDPVKTPGEYFVYMPGGSKTLTIVVPGCRPKVYSFPAPLLSAYAYKMEIELEDIGKARLLIMPTFSYNKSQLSYGLMLGFGKGMLGGFVHAKTDFHFGLNPDISCDADGNVNGVKGWFTGESQKSRFAITAGWMPQIVGPLYAYVGAGYGRRILAWEMYQSEKTYDYVRVEPCSFTGFEVELGVIFRLNPGISFSAGVQTNQFKYYEANVGIGVML